MSNKIVFFGSGPVAAESLRLLLKHQEIEAVITKPSTKHEMQRVAKDLTVYSVSNKKELDDLIESKNFTSKLGILIDFGIIVSQKTINYFEKGIVNSHFSLLPQLRGADPITFALLSGQKQTGVSLMLLVEAMDEGPILAQGIYNIKDDETGPTLTEQLILLSDALLSDNLASYIDNIPHPKTKKQAVPRPQEEVNAMLKTPLEVSYSRKLTKADGVLDFTKPAEILDREIRAFIDWPKSRTVIAGKDVIITKAHFVPSVSPNDKPGDITVVKEASTLMIATSRGSLCIEELKPAGKKEMPVKAFLAGYGSRL